MALRTTGPYPVLVLQGEQGSAKSTAAKVLKYLIDPVTPLVRSLPRSERDLVVAAAGNWVLAFDNVSFIPDWASDAFCRLSTGGGFGARTHYSNEEETVFEQSRPIILNGIDAVARRQDLLDRSLVVQFPTIREDQRVPEDNLWKAIEAARPAILRGLLDAATCAHNRIDEIETERLPRLADFARWTTAAEPVLGWEPNTFVDLLESRQATVLRDSLEGSPLAGALVSWMRLQNWTWEGTPTGLYSDLSLHAGDTSRRKGWPNSAQSMSVSLSRLEPALRKIGMKIERTYQGRGKAKERWVTIKQARPGDDGDAGDVPRNCARRAAVLFSFGLTSCVNIPRPRMAPHERRVLEPSADGERRRRAPLGVALLGVRRSGRRSLAVDPAGSRQRPRPFRRGGPGALDQRGAQGVEAGRQSAGDVASEWCERLEAVKS